MTDRNDAPPWLGEAAEALGEVRPLNWTQVLNAIRGLRERAEKAEAELRATTALLAQTREALEASVRVWQRMGAIDRTTGVWSVLGPAWEKALAATPPEALARLEREAALALVETVKRRWSQEQRREGCPICVGSHDPDTGAWEEHDDDCALARTRRRAVDEAEYERWALWVFTTCRHFGVPTETALRVAEIFVAGLRARGEP